MSYRLNTNVILKGDEGLFIAYDTKKGNIIEVNEIAFQILKFCKKSRDISEIITKIKKEYEDFPKEEKLKEDIEKIIDFFMKKNLLKNG
jgi:DNA-binding cell septation regulator SpoVG